MFEEVAEGAKRIAGRVVVGSALTLAALAPVPSNAQQVAANGVAPQSVSISAQCASLKDAGAQLTCEIQRRDAADLAKLRVNTQTTNVGTQALNDETECGKALRNLRESDPTVVERGRAILANRPASAYGLCKLLVDLKKS